MRQVARRGQSLVEFALFVSVLLALLAGLLNFGALLNAHLAVTYATRQGALSGATAGNATLADCDALAAVAVALVGEGDVQVSQIVIYQAASDGLPIGGEGNTTFADVYAGNPGCSNNLTPPTPTVANWLPATRDANITHATMLGVEVDYTFSWQNAIFPLPPLSVVDRTVIPLGTG
jgi:hypothetical protein